MSHFLRRFVTVACVLSLSPVTLSGLEAAQGKGQSKGKAKSEKKQGGNDQSEFSLEFLIDFSSKDARLYATQSELIGQKPLPPGIQKNLARGKPLPPGIAKRQMPESFLKKLPAHDDYEWRMAGADLLLVARTDNIVVEIAADVFK